MNALDLIKSARKDLLARNFIGAKDQLKKAIAEDSDNLYAIDLLRDLLEALNLEIKEVEALIKEAENAVADKQEKILKERNRKLESERKYTKNYIEAEDAYASGNITAAHEKILSVLEEKPDDHKVQQLVALIIESCFEKGDFTRVIELSRYVKHNDKLRQLVERAQAKVKKQEQEKREQLIARFEGLSAVLSDMQDSHAKQQCPLCGKKFDKKWGRCLKCNELIFNHSTSLYNRCFSNPTPLNILLSELDYPEVEHLYNLLSKKRSLTNRST